MLRPFAALIFLSAAFASVSGETKPVREPREFLPAPFDRYFERRVKELSDAPWQKDITPENWPAMQADMRKKLQRMLGLDPYPERTPLNATITGTLNGDGFVVEKLHFQSVPGLYVGANLYRPKDVPQPLPAILYVCGHAKVVEGSVIYGNKTGYEHHGAWFARHGYVCLAIDTIQLGEIKGEHAGTYSLGRWWWPARGYTPGGVETWSGIRALDYLLTRPEVDAARIGMTGRSGGGAYSWFVAALDDRVKVVAPTAGVATLKNHVLDGAIEGHCDCMFYVNTERWNFDRLAALIAPRPLLISNSDKDDIFPLDGVYDIYQRTRALYRALKKEENIGFHVAEGPHKDTQQLNIGAFNWLNRFLKGGDRADFIDEPARKMMQPRELKVFAEIPKDERVTTADEYFVPGANVKIEALTKESWPRQRDEWVRVLRNESFRAWPNETNAKASVKAESSAEGVKLTVCEFLSEEPFTLNIWLLQPEALKAEQLDSLKLVALNEDDWQPFRARTAAGFATQFSETTADVVEWKRERASFFQAKQAIAYFCPRGIGPGGWTKLSPNKQTQLRRRLLLLGESLESGQVWDIRQAVAALRSLPGFSKTPLTLQSKNIMAANALYASLFIPELKSLELIAPPPSHRNGATYLNVLRHFDMPQALAMAVERVPVTVSSAAPETWQYARRAVEVLGWEGRLSFK